jgi:fluoride exporter
MVILSIRGELRLRLASGRQHTRTVARRSGRTVQGPAMWKAIVAISVGASLGALLRWWLGTTLNPQFPAIPPGTLAANLIGGYVVGMAMAFFATYTAVAPEWRLLVITGFCGGLTTFSTFSAELVTLMQQGRTAWALAAAAAHLLGSVVMTFAGIGTVLWVRSLRG